MSKPTPRHIELKMLTIKQIDEADNMITFEMGNNEVFVLRTFYSIRMVTEGTIISTYLADVVVASCAQERCLIGV